MGQKSDCLTHSWTQIGKGSTNHHFLGGDLDLYFGSTPWFPVDKHIIKEPILSFTESNVTECGGTQSILAWMSQEVSIWGSKWVIAYLQMDI